MLDFLKLLLYQMVYLLAKRIPARKGTQHLLIVKVDEIGDYILVRNCLSYIRSSPRFKRHRITFLGNKIYRELFEQFDGDSANNTIWLDKKKYRRNPFYRFQLFKTLRKNGYSDALNLIYSRSWRLDDVLISVSGAPMRIGMNNSSMPMSNFENTLRNKNTYTELLWAGDDKTFDAIRNATFVSELIGNVVPAATHMEVDPAGEFVDSYKKYCVIFPGSGIRDKKWAPENFSKVAAHLANKWKLQVVVCGAAADKMDADNFLNAFQQQAFNLVGITTLPALLSVLRSAVCLVCVDTGAVHLAAAVDCPVFGLFNGLHYGRFAPYPAEIANNFYPIYPDIVDSMIADGSIDDTKVGMDFVKLIGVQKVIDTIDAFFEKQCH